MSVVASRFGMFSIDLPRENIVRHILAIGTILIIAAAAPFAATQENITRASALLGHYVVTYEGEELGKIEDIAIDQASGEIAYVVVSIASFLIDDSLIAVHPDALLPLRDSESLVLNTDQDLRDVARFADDGWPRRASVLPSNTAPLPITDSDDGPTFDEAAPPISGTATITGSTRTATLSAGVRRITPIQVPIATPTVQISTLPYDGPLTAFDRLDKDGNGILNRPEIAHQLTNRDKYTDIDEDGNGVIDRFEFDLLIERQEQN